MTIAEARGLGRHGDDHLIHVSGAELEGLNSLAQGGLSTNPETGLPEAFKLKKLLGAALPLAAMFIPGVGPAISAALMGTGMSAGAAALAAPALMGGLGSAISGGNLKEVALSAALGGLGGKLFPAPALGGAANAAAAAAAPTAAAAAAPAAVDAAAKGVAQGVATEAAKETAKKSILPKLLLGGLGLSAAFGSPRARIEEEPNRNPYAGHEVQNPRVQLAPPPGYRPGIDPQWSYFRPADTTGAYHIDPAYLASLGVQPDELPYRSPYAR